MALVRRHEPPLQLPAGGPRRALADKTLAEVYRRHDAGRRSMSSKAISSRSILSPAGAADASPEFAWTSACSTEVEDCALADERYFANGDGKLPAELRISTKSTTTNANT